MRGDVTGQDANCPQPDLTTEPRSCEGAARSGFGTLGASQERGNSLGHNVFLPERSCKATRAKGGFLATQCFLSLQEKGSEALLALRPQIDLN